MLVAMLEEARFLVLRPGRWLDPGGLFGDHRVRLRADTLLDHLDIDRIFLEPVVERHLEVEQFRKTRLHALDIPLFGIAALWARIGNDRVDGVAAHVLDDFGRSEEHTSELQSLMRISYAIFCLKKEKKTTTTHSYTHRVLHI